MLKDADIPGTCRGGCFLQHLVGTQVDLARDIGMGKSKAAKRAVHPGFPRLDFERDIDKVNEIGFRDLSAAAQGMGSCRDSTSKRCVITETLLHLLRPKHQGIGIEFVHMPDRRINGSLAGRKA